MRNLMALWVLAVLLSACGNKGELYLPDRQSLAPQKLWTQLPYEIALPRALKT